MVYPLLSHVETLSLYHNNMACVSVPLHEHAYTTDEEALYSAKQAACARGLNASTDRRPSHGRDLRWPTYSMRMRALRAQT